MECFMQSLDIDPVPWAGLVHFQFTTCPHLNKLAISLVILYWFTMNRPIFICVLHQNAVCNPNATRIESIILQKMDIGINIAFRIYISLEFYLVFTMHSCVPPHSVLRVFIYSQRFPFIDVYWRWQQKFSFIDYIHKFIILIESHAKNLIQHFQWKLINRIILNESQKQKIELFHKNLMKIKCFRSSFRAGLWQSPDPVTMCSGPTVMPRSHKHETVKQEHD